MRPLHSCCVPVAPQHVAAERVSILLLRLVTGVQIPEQGVYHVSLALQSLHSAPPSVTPSTIILKLVLDYELNTCTERQAVLLLLCPPLSADMQSAC